MQRNARVLENRADLDGELLAAVAALPKPIPHALRRVSRDFVRRADDAAVWTLGAMWPDNGFKETMGGFFIAEIWAVQYAHFGHFPLKHRFLMP